MPDSGLGHSGASDQATPQGIRRWRVRVKAEGYAVTFGATKKEAVQNAREGTYLRTPRPEWWSQISDIEEIQ